VRPRESIFDSSSEQELFQAINGFWEPRYHLYPHIPFANLIDLDPQQLSADELSFLHKTTVDYVLVERDGKPLLAIEFDGLGHGISRQGRYIQKVSSKRDPKRGWKLNLKVRVAKSVGFPFLIMSYDEKAVIDEDTNLTVLHGIVGQFVAGLQIGPRIQELIAEQQSELDELTSDEQYDARQDMVIAAEIDADMEYNPVCRRAAELSTVLSKEYGVSGCSFGYVEEPPRPAKCHPWEKDFDDATFRNWWNNIERIGCNYRLETPRGEIARTVWVRNFEGSGVSPFGFLQELAELVTCKAALFELDGGPLKRKLPPDYLSSL
jgi:Protein of unknown function (DUF2726)